MVNLISNEPKTGCYLLPILSNLQALKVGRARLPHVVSDLPGTISLKRDWTVLATACAEPCPRPRLGGHLAPTTAFPQAHNTLLTFLRKIGSLALPNSFPICFFPPHAAC
jgi:hypothetical protein